MGLIMAQSPLGLNYSKQGAKINLRIKYSQYNDSQN